MENCIFCSIINGDIPAEKLYEDNQVLAEVIQTEDIEEEPEIWELPYNVPLNVADEGDSIVKNGENKSQDITEYRSVGILVLLAIGGAGYYFHHS